MGTGVALRVNTSGQVVRYYTTCYIVKPRVHEWVGLALEYTLSHPFPSEGDGRG